MSLQIYHPSDGQLQQKLEAFVRSPRSGFHLGFLQLTTGEFLTWRYLDHSYFLTDQLCKGSSTIWYLRNTLKTIGVIGSPSICFSSLWIFFLIFSFGYIVSFSSECLTSLESAAGLETSPSVIAVPPCFSKLAPCPPSFQLFLPSKLSIKRNGNAQKTEAYQGEYFLRQGNTFIYVKSFPLLVWLIFLFGKRFSNILNYKKIKNSPLPFLSYVPL